MNHENTQGRQALSARDDEVSALQQGLRDIDINISSQRSGSTLASPWDVPQHRTGAMGTAVHPTDSTSRYTLSNAEARRTSETGIRLSTPNHRNQEPGSHHAFDAIRDPRRGQAQLARWMLQTPEEEPWHPLRAVPLNSGAAPFAQRAESAMPAQENMEARLDTTNPLTGRERGIGQRDNSK